MYDAVMVWALAVNLTLEEGKDINNGLEVTENIYNMTFEGMSGLVVINSVGDRLYDYEVLSYQNGMNIPILLWSAKEGKLNKIYKGADKNDWTGLVWFGNATEIPSDSPECGWKNERCLSGSSLDSGLAAAMIVVIFVILVIAGCIAIWRIT